MNDNETIQSYVNNFRRHISPYLKPGIGLSFRIYPARQEGAVLEISIGQNISNEDHFETMAPSANAALSRVPHQRIVGGNIDAFKFGGTNISMEPNRIVLIKGEDDADLWNDQAAKNDVERIVGTQTRSRK
jgi:hypothetical protein